MTQTHAEYQPSARRARRQFLKRMAAAIPVLGFAASYAGPAHAKPSEVDPYAIKKLGASLKGRIVLPADNAYDRIRRIQFWNAETERWPALIVRVAHNDDILRTVAFARHHGLETAVRAGGHSFQGWGISNGVVIDLSEMKGTSIDSTKRIGRVSGGVLGGEFVSSAGAHGLAPVLGQCPAVGVAGLTLGGGLGWLSGEHGAACDNLLSATIVTADGRLLEVSAAHNADLFWAIRGGSGNFGVVTSLDFRLHPVDQVLCGEIFFPIRDLRAVLHAYHELMGKAPDNFQADLVFLPGDQAVLVSSVQFGDAAEGDKQLAAIRAWGTSSRENIKRKSFLEHAGMPPNNPDAPSPTGFSSCKGASLESLSDAAIDAIVDCVAKAPPGCAMGISHYMHGAVCRVKPEATAFELRQPDAVNVWIGSFWQDVAVSEFTLGWASETSQRLRLLSGNRIYLNYQSYEGKGSAQAVFGGNHARLAAIKRKYDPSNFFRRNSNISPA